ncbi:peptidase [Gardnerella vaginalis]|uniref:Peptidase n=1 Tax=Gardnerella vaginalis TaxID=2702 RepID=A0A3E1J1M7_GARVA|nr:FIVAR domain-containing protein [Gardnerella vaginalis]RFD80261.1 peptidase [Gardnerella vaginalis]
MASSNSRRHARKVTLDAAVSNAISKAVKARKVAAFTVGAAGVLAGAAFAFGATPAMAAESGALTSPAPAPVTDISDADIDAVADALSDDDNNNGAADGDSAGDKDKQSVVNPEDDKSKNPATTDDNKDKATAAKRRTRRAAAEDPQIATTGPNYGEDRDASTTPESKPQANSTIELSEDKKDTLPNMYTWGSSNNTYIESGQSNTVTFNFAKPTDGYKISSIAIFPAQNNSLTTDRGRKAAEYYSGNLGLYQPYSGEYAFTPNTDGSATLKMTPLFRDGNLKSGENYAANRCIYVYGKKDNESEVLLYKTNIARAATLIPPKTAGSIVLKYNEELTTQQIQKNLKAALDAPTEATGNKSIRDQITAASTSKGVGGHTGANGAFVQTPDTAENKVVITDQRAYDPSQLIRINRVTSQAGQPTAYVAGAQTLKTYLVSDLGYTSEVLPLTIARYDTRIQKPIVDEVDIKQLTDDQKADIIKKLAQLNHVPQDKVTFNDKGDAVINFDGVDTADAPKIALSDLVLKKFKDGEYKVPSDAEDSKVKAVVVANPLGYSNAELKQIKKAIYEANKDNQELGLSAKDYENQITLDWITGDTTASGGNNTGISNGMNENKITVTIRTDKAYAQFKSDVQKHELTRLIDLRKDYTLSWEDGKNKINGRDTDEGLAWMEDGKTLVYRYDPDKGEQINTQAVLDLLKATVKSDVKTDNPQLRDNLLGSEITTVKREGLKREATRSHRSYTVDDNGEPIGVLNLVKLNGGGYGGFAKPVDNSNKKMGDEQSSVNDYTFDDDSQKVSVAGKKGKCMIGRLFIEPYSLYYYNYVYGENKYNLRNTPKGINVVFVPQTNHKTKDLKESVGKHAVTQDEKKTPTDSAYYNASDAKKAAYDDALKEANEALKLAGTTEDSKLSEELKARIDNATINLNKARAELDGPDTSKDGLNASIDANGKAAEGATAEKPGTVTTDKYKNVTEPDFKKADGKADDAKNKAAKEAKKAYDEALQAAEAARDDANATQKAVDDAKAKLDAAREKLNDFTTNKDELNNAIAQNGKVNTGDTSKQGDEKLKTADPTYQNSSKDERDAYDAAVKKAGEVVADPNASQKEVNEAIKKLKDAKDALDKNATDKSPLDAAVQKSFDNPDPDNANGKKSVFYTNAKNKTGDTAAQKAVKDYDDALKKAKQVLADKNATKKDVEDAKSALEKAEEALHADKYQTKKTDLAKALADNFSGYLMPAYFNAFDLSQSKTADAAKVKKAAEDFKKYNDAYHAAKKLMTELNKPNSTITQDEVNKVKNQLVEARKLIDTYATDTSRLSAAAFNDIAIQKSPAYKNVSADDASEEAKEAKKKYDAAVEKLHKALANKLPKDKANGQDIPDGNTPKADGDLNNKDYLKDIQAHKNGEPLDRDVDAILKEMNAAAAELNKFATKTDALLKSVNEDAATHQNPAFKNASRPDYKNESGQADTDKNGKASKAVDDYGKALNEAKDLLKDPTATQAKVDAAKKKLDEARKALDAYNTDTTKLKDSVDKNGKDAEGANPAVEGTKDSDAYRNASDPHFLTADGKPDDTRNNAAKQAKADYDKALAKAQELLKKHDDKDTPQDAKPTQKEINDALKALDDARTEIEKYKTDTTALNTEAEKSQADTEGSVATGKFEDTPEFKNAKAKTSDGNENVDVTAYKKALATARKLVSDAKDTSKKNSERPSQQQINDALDALKQAKKQIADNYKTNLEPLTSAKDFADDGFKKTPEYQNAVAKKTAGDQGATKDLGEADKGFDNVLAKVAAKLNDNDWKQKATQKEVNALLKQLQDAQDNIAKKYKTDATPLSNEVGDKDQDGKPVVPPFEASVAYKNALEKANAESKEDAEKDTSATKKLKAYNEKLKAAQDLINKVNNPDPNAKPEDRPTQAKVDEALDALKKAKQDIDNTFKTKVDDLQKEVDDKDNTGTAKVPDIENTTEFANLKAKVDGDKKPDDLVAYEQALAKAKELIDKNDGKVTKDGKEVDVPKDQLPSQKEVDEALKNLKEIKDKITKNYVTSPHDLQEEVDKSKDGDTDTSTDVFENTPAFKNATAKGDDAAKQALDDYNKKLKAAKDLLAAFDPKTGKPVTTLPTGMTQAPTQKELDDALKALQDAKKKLTDEYSTNKSDLSTEAGKDSAFTKSPEYVNAQAKGDDASKQALDEYKKALDEANSVLGNENATQTEVDAALRKLEDAKKKLTDGYGTDSSKLKSEADADGDFTKSPEYLNAQSKGDDASEQDLEAYKKALEDANKVLGDANATQAQVDEALKKLQDAKKKLTDSHKTDKAALQTESDADGDFTKTPEYQNAVGSPEAEAYKKALDEANSVLKDPQATQAQVDAALKKLQDAKRVINDEYATQKQALKDEVAKSKDDSDSESDGQGSGDSKFEDSLAYKNAAGTPELDEYKRALENARRVLADPHATRSAVLAALSQLKEIKRIIIEKYSVDKSALRSAVDSDPWFRKSTAYIVAESRDVDSYKQAFEEAKRVLDAVNTNQAQIDDALQSLEEAKRVIIDKFNALGNGGSGTGFGTGTGYGHLGDQNPLIVQSADKSGLQQIIEDALRVVSQHSEAYKRLAGSVEVKRYDDALANAQNVVADANASRDMVNTAGAELRDASGVLLRRIEMYEGKGNRGGKIANTGAGVSLFAWASAIFAGLGFAGVSRRRKHSDK